MSNRVILVPDENGNKPQIQLVDGSGNIITSLGGSTTAPLYHTTIAFGSLPLATTAYSFFFKSVLNYNARNRSITIVNNTNQNSGAVKVYTYDDANTGVNYQDASANLAVQVTAGVWGGGNLVALKDGQGVGGIANCLYVNITTGSTAPTSGQFDIYVREVLA